MEAIILAGGLGTRLAHIVSNVPKPMAPVAGQPFMVYIVEDLIKKGINKITFAVGYKKEIIIAYFGNDYKNCKIQYSDEEEPLQTGGAIKKALTKCSKDEVFVVNGDTYFDVDLMEMLKFHNSKQAEVTVASKEMRNFDRYGTLLLENERIVDFEEKKTRKSGMINGGIYILNRHILDNMCEVGFSFEQAFLEAYVDKYQMYAYCSEGYFIDIGVEEDYFKAQKDFNVYE